MNYRTALSLCLLFCFFVLFGCRHTPAVADQQSAEPRYLQYNIHAQQHEHDAKASYANWTDPGKGHFIVPAGTAIEIGGFRSGFSIFTLPDKKEILFEYHEGRMGMSADGYIKLITSTKPVSLEGFSQIDRKGIADGKAYEGMTKKGVMTALGYPATHRTPSPEANTWIYWTNRFKTYAVDFDDRGIVKQIRR